MLALLTRLNRTTVFLVTIGLVLLGLFLPGPPGAALLVALAGGLGALLVRTWAIQQPATRAIRLVVLALLVLVASVKAF